MHLRVAPSQRLLLLVLAFGAVARATTFVDRPFPESVQDAPVIVRGKIGQSYPEWGLTSGGQRNIYTYTELQVEEVFKGEVPEGRIYMRELGGEKDGVGMNVAGTAQFRRGEDVVVFLGGEVHPDGARDLHGMMMGKFNVERDENGQEYLSGPGLGAGVDPAHRAEAHFRESEGQGDTGRQKRWDLESLRELVRQQAGGSPESTPGANAVREQRNSQLSEPGAGRDAEKRAAAPQLQPQMAGGDSASRHGLSKWLWMIGVLAGLWIFIRVVKRR